MAATPEFLRMPFKEALEYFKSKSVFPTENSKQFMAEQHDFAFTVAGLTKADLLTDLKFLITEAIEKGNDLDIFKSQVKQLLGKKGWQPSGQKLSVIFDTNLRRSYSAGRLQQMNDPELMKSRRFRMWVHRDSPNPRPQHIALNGKVFPADHDFWRTCMPPTGYQCRCGVFSLSDRDLLRMGKKVEEPPDPKLLLEPGFERSAGTAPLSERKQILRDGLSRLSPDLKSKVKADLKSKGLI